MYFVRVWTVVDEDGKMRLDVAVRSKRCMAEYDYALWRCGGDVGWWFAWQKLRRRGCRAVKITVSEGWQK
jgi:hypothetical protein